MKGIAQDFLERVHSTGFVSSQAVNALVEEIQQKLSDFDNALITQCLNGIRDVDEYLYVHCLNVGFLNAMIANWCGLDRDMCVKLTRAGLVHDLGKLKISPSILNKPGKLSELEYESIKHHPSFLKSNDADSQRMGVGVFCRLRGGAGSFSQRFFFLAGLCGTLLLLCV